jgi:amino acid adenylation domain-containing protein
MTSITPGQRALWFFQRADLSSTAYHIGGILWLRGSLDPGRFGRAVERMVRRHPMLRASFPGEDGEPRCVIAPDPSPGFFTAEHADDTVSEFLRRIVLVPFDLERGPLARFHLVAVAPEVHLFVVVVHHIVADLGSFSLLLREFPDHYREDDRPVQIQPEFSWQAFAHWQAGIADSPEGQREIAFWRRTLPATLPVIDFEAGIGESGAPEPLRRPLARTSVRILQELAEATGTSVHAVLLAAWGLVTARHAGRREVVIGVPRSLRSRRRFSDLVGYLINTVLVSIAVRDGEPFRALIARTAGSLRRSLANGLVPFPEVAKRLRLASRPNAPIFQSMVAWYPEDDEAAAMAVRGAGKDFPWGPWEATPESLPATDAHCDVLLLTVPQGSDLHCEVRLSPHGAARAFARNALDRMECLLEASAEFPDIPYSERSLVSPGDLERMSSWNATSVRYDAPPLMHECVSAQAARTPQVRLADEEGELTLGELDAKSTVLALRLAGLGVRQGDRVGMALRPTLGRVAAMLGILKAGGAFVPLDPTATPPRRVDLVRAAEASLLIVEDSQAAAPAEVPWVALDELLAGDWNSPEADLPKNLDDRSVAYVLFTSGSSGRPKGVMVPHAAIRNRILWMRDAFPLVENDAVLHKTPLTFDVALWEVFLPLIAGARLVVAPDGAQRDPILLADLLPRQGITMAHFVPTVLRAFLAAAQPGGCPDLRCVVASGEVLDAGICDAFFARFPQASLHNLYGPTEAAVDVTAWKCEPGWRGPVPIGRAIANVQLYVLDEGGRQVPIGSSGELYIEGVALATGYLSRPDLTAERFRVIVVDGTARRAYATGDYARYRPDGALEFLGRRDRQVKLAGVRLELDGVEARLLDHPAVLHAAVLAVRVEDVDQLSAYVVTEVDVSDAELKAHLSERLPPPAVPARFVRLSRLPVLTSGKVDYRSLPTLAGERGAAGLPPLALSDPLEAALQRAWSKVLGVPLMDRDADFFALGGDSIRVLQVQAELAKQGWALRSQDFVRNPTIGTLATVLTLLELADATRPFELLDPEERAELSQGHEDAFPLSSVQQSLLFHSRYEDAYEVYTLTFRFAGLFDGRRLEEAAIRLHERHDLLRVSYVYTSRLRFVQAVNRSVRLDLTFVDARGWDERRAKLRDWLVAERRRLFDWSTAPLFRLTVHLLEEQLFQLTVSHAFFDGWSVANLIGELMADYVADLASATPQGSEPPRVAFREFVKLERDAGASPESWAFWERQVDGALPTLLSRASPDGGEPRLARRLSRELPTDVIEKLRGLTAKTGTPLKSLLLAVHLRVLALIAGRDDVITALLVNGRPEGLDGDKVVGMFLNPVPMRLNVEGLDWLELARAAWQAEQDLSPHRRYPFAAMGVHAHRVVDSAFNYIHLHTLERLATMRSVQLVGWESPADQTFFPMTAYFHLEAGSGRLFFYLDTFGDVVTAELGERIAGYYERGLAGCAETPDSKPSSLDFLSPWEIQLQLREWNDTRRDWAPGRDRAVHRLFSAVAAQAPRSGCLRYRGASLEYGEVDALSNRLASTLRAKGFGRSQVAGVLVEPGPAWPVAVLGVLAAGGAFLPLDPASPPGRLCWLLEDAQVRVVVTDDAAAARVIFDEAEILEIDLSRAERFVSTEGDSAGPDDLAYILYTSGSTGMPKGVEVTHHSLVNVLLAFQELTGIGSGDCLLSVSPSTFDISVLEMLLPLISGGCLIVADRALRADPAGLIREMERERPTLMQATPATWRLLIEAGWQGDPGLSILCGGDVLTRPLADALLPRCAQLWNVYGPTEATIWCTCEPVHENPEDPTVGRPLPNTEAYILGPRLEPLPVGTAGSLHIAGRALARGYRHGETGDSPRFLPNPLGKGRLHSTGDQARYMDDGRIEILGRADDQVKRSGMRLHLSEVEKALERLPEVEAAAVLVTGGHPGTLEACLVVRGEGLPTGELRTRLEELLPAWMVPARFHCVPALPLTAHGKLDRAALTGIAQAALERADEERDPVEPASPHDQAVADVIGAVIGVERVGMSARFDALGAGSLTMLRVLQALEARGLIGLSLPELMSCATVADLADRLVRTPVPSAAQKRGTRRRSALSAMRRPRGESS